MPGPKYRPFSPVQPPRRWVEGTGDKPNALLAHWLQVEDLGRDVLAAVHPGHEPAHLASRDLLDRADELVARRLLEEQSRLLQALVLVHLDHLLLGRSEAVLERRNEGVPVRVGRLRLRRAAPELFLIDPDHRVRDPAELRVPAPYVF